MAHVSMDMIIRNEKQEAENDKLVALTSLHSTLDCFVRTTLLFVFIFLAPNIVPSLDQGQI